MFVVVGFMSYIPSLPDWSIGLANDWVWVQGCFGHCTRTFIKG